MTRSSSHLEREGPAQSVDAGLPLLRILNILLSHVRVIVWSGVGLAALVVAASLIMGPSYTSSAVFMPQAEDRNLSRLANVAAQFGFDAPLGEAGEGPDFYADLLESRKVLESTVLTEYCGSESEAHTGCGDLVSWYEIDRATRAKSVSQAVGQLREDVVVTAMNETGTVEFSVTTDWPSISKQIADRLLDLINTYNLERRQSQVAAERVFVEDRLQEARQDLHAVEDSLRRFLERNRRYQNSPQLIFEYDRFQRRVGLEQQVVQSLAQTFEQTKIKEVRDTPVLTLVDPPIVPAEADERHLLIKSVLSLILGASGAAFLLVCVEFFHRAAADDPEGYRQFRDLVDGWRAQFAGLWRRFRRLPNRER